MSLILLKSGPTPNPMLAALQALEESIEILPKFPKGWPDRRWLPIVEEAAAEQRRRLVAEGGGFRFGFVRKLRHLRRASGLHSYLSTHAFSAAAIWGGMTGQALVFRRICERVGLPVLLFELGPMPGYVLCETRGYADQSGIPKDPNFYRSLDAAVVDDTAWRTAAAGLRARPAAHRHEDYDNRNLPSSFVFCPLQVAGDAQVVDFGGRFSSIRDVITAVAKAAQFLPDGWRIIFKEHPSCKVGNADQLRALVGDRVQVANSIDTFDLVRRSRAVVTLNSSVGLQACFYNKPVLILGEALFDVRGIVDRAGSDAEMQSWFTNVTQQTFDADLRSRFFAYLCNAYLIPLYLLHTREGRDDAAVRLRRLIEKRATELRGADSAGSMRCRGQAFDPSFPIAN